MERPEVYLARLNGLLTYTVQESAECSFIGFPCYPTTLTGMLELLGPLPATAVPAVILPAGHAPQREPDRGPPRCEEHPDP
jgi:hypothetical protein